MTARDDLAARLAEHSQVRILGWRCGSCGVPLSRTGSADALAAHQADVALAWFQEQTTEEWGVLYERTAVTLETVTQIDQVRDERTAHEWVEHKYPPIPNGWNHRAAHRRVTAWESVEEEEA